jgi:hypothetical protein
MAVITLPHKANSAPRRTLHINSFDCNALRQWSSPGERPASLAAALTLPAG